MVCKLKETRGMAKRKVLISDKWSPSPRAELPRPRPPPTSLLVGFKREQQ